MREAYAAHAAELYGLAVRSLGDPEGTVKSRVYYGLPALRVVLEEMGYED